MGREAKKRHQRRVSRHVEGDVTAVAPAPEPASPRSKAKRWRWTAIAGGVVVTAGVAWGLARWHTSTRPAPAPAPAPAPVPAPTIASLHETEPNDTFETAQRLVWPDSDVAAEASGDRDAYVLSINRDGPFLLDAWIEGGDGLAVEVTSRNRSLRKSVVAPGQVRSFGIAREVGPMFVMVDGGAAGVGSRPYHLQVRTRRWVPGEESEPNDGPDSADEASPQMAGAWSHPGDVDCFRVPLSVPPAGLVLRFLLAPPRGVRGRLRVLDSGNPKAKVAPRILAAVTSATRGEDAILPAIGGRSWEPYYAACMEAEDATRFPANYRFLVTSWTPPSPFEFEPNDTPETGSALPRSGTVAGYLPTGDVDWYRISHAPGPEVRVAITLPPAVSAELALYDAEQRELVRGVGAPGETLEQVAPAASFARVRVTTGGNLDETYTIASPIAPEAGAGADAP